MASTWRCSRAESSSARPRIRTARSSSATDRIGSRPAARQRETKRGSAADDRMDVDLAAHARHDAVADPEAQSHSGAGALRREERLEDVSRDLVGDARAGVGNLDQEAPVRMTPGADPN